MIGPFDRPWDSQPQDAPSVDWSDPLNAGLAFCAPLSAATGARDIVQNQTATRTGTQTLQANSYGVFESFASGRYLSFPRKPIGIGPTTPATIAWTQEPRSTSAYSAVVNLQVGTPGTDNSVLVYTSASDATFYFAAGPRRGGGAHKWSAAVGASTNNVRDAFVLVASAGLIDTTGSNWVLYRNGALVAREASTNFGANASDGFVVGALIAGTDPYEGLIGDLHIWSRALGEGEARKWSANVNSTYERHRISIPVAAAGGGGSIGTLTYTNANDTSNAAGTLTIIGSTAYSNNNDTIVASGSTTLTGTLARTNASDTIVATGSTTIIGTLVRTNANDTLAANGSTGNITGTLAYTNINDSIVASGVVPIVGTFSRTNANDTLVASGTAGSTYSVTIKAGSWLRYRTIQ
jgi:hypothetical protein